MKGNLNIYENPKTKKVKGKENAKDNEQSEDFEGGHLQEINDVKGEFKSQFLPKQSLKSLEN